MSVISKISAAHLTGSTAGPSSANDAVSNAGRLLGAGQPGSGANFNLPAGASLDGLTLSGYGPGHQDLSGVLQLLADSIGKLNGNADWLNREPGEIKFGDKALGSTKGGNEYDILLTQMKSTKKIELDSAGVIKVGSTYAGGGGSIGVLIDSKTSDNGAHAMILSASGGNNADIKFNAHHFSFGFQTSAVAANSESLWINKHGNSVVFEGRQGAGVALKAGAGAQASLSGSATNSPIGFSCGDSAGSAYPNSQGPGGIALYHDLAEAASWVTNFAQNTTLMGAIVANKVSIGSDTTPTLFKLNTGLPTSPNALLELGKIAGGNTNLGGFADNSVKLYLNGQLLLSASGGAGGNVSGDGDYALSGDGTSNQLKVGFGLEEGDIIRAFMFG